MSFLGLFEVGSLLCAAAQTSDMFIVGRTIAGIGGSGLATGGLTIISACVPLEKRASEFVRSRSTVQSDIYHSVCGIHDVR